MSNCSCKVVVEDVFSTFKLDALFTFFPAELSDNEHGGASENYPVGQIVDAGRRLDENGDLVTA